MTTDILFLGLNRTSVSLGLVMKKNADLIRRTGFDPDNSAIKSAIHMGALDQSSKSLMEGVKEADVIIYSLPAGQLLEVIKTIRSDIKPGCVFISINLIGHDTFDQVSQALPDPNAFITWIPALNPNYIAQQEHGADRAQEDLFIGSHVFISGGFNTRPVALKAGNDLAILAGALPIYSDPTELSGILALSHDFPRLMSAVITRLITSEPGWNEARKLAGYDFQSISDALISFENQHYPGVPLYANRKNLQRLIKMAIDELQEMHAALEIENNLELSTAIKNAIVARQIWQKQRKDMSWLEKSSFNSDAPHSITEMIFGKRGKKS